MQNEHLIRKLAERHSLTEAEYACLIDRRDEASAALLATLAKETAQAVYGRAVFVRGLIEVSNLCKNDCLYCGIRRSNKNCTRYRLTEPEILACAEEGYGLGFRTFVLQGGEDGYFTDEVLCSIVKALKRTYPDCAVTLSLGERPFESYRALKEAGADRYLLRHETATQAHYQQLHPAAMSFQNRMDCLRDLKALGYQTGCGFMVGSPGQTTAHLAADLKFIEQFRPEMCGIGPFIPHKDTPFRDHPAGSVELTCYLLSMIRLIHPPVLLPATTALGTMDPQGREKGILAGANVVMPNLSPEVAKANYTLYNNKLTSGAESAQHLDDLKARMAAIGYQVVTARGDYKM